MKKRYIVLIVVIILVVIALASVFTYYYINENAKKYEIEKIDEYNYFVLKQENVYGVIDKKGNKIINAEYTNVVIPNPEKPIFICYKDEEVKVLTEGNQQLLTDYEGIEPIRFKNILSDLMYEKSVLKYKKDGKYGIINFDGKMLTNPIYDEIDSLQHKEGELLVKQGEKYGIININGKELIKPQYDTIAIDEYYSDENNYTYSGYIVGIKTEEGYRYGYLDYKGKKILEPEYNNITRVTQKMDNENAYLICAKNGQYGINKNGENIVANEYQSIRYDENNDIFVIEKSREYGIANVNGEIVVPVRYSQIDSTGLYLYAQDDQGTTVYNNNGSQVNINPNISIIETKNEKYKIRINSEQGTKYGVINQDGRQLIEEKYNYINYLYDNYFIASYENGKLGILDDRENVIIQLDNDSLRQISGTDLIQTSKTATKTITIYSKNFEKICEMQNATLKEEENYIKLYNETEIKYFDKQGKELNNADVYPNNKLLLKFEANKYGFVDRQGNLVVECKYDKAYEFNEYGFAAVEKDGKWGVLDEQGNEVITPTYTFNDFDEPIFIGPYYRVIYGFGEVYYTNAN